MLQRLGKLDDDRSPGASSAGENGDARPCAADPEPESRTGRRRYADLAKLGLATRNRSSSASPPRRWRLIRRRDQILPILALTRLRIPVQPTRIWFMPVRLALRDQLARTRHGNMSSGVDWPFRRSAQPGGCLPRHSQRTVRRIARCDIWASLNVKSAKPDITRLCPPCRPLWPKGSAAGLSISPNRNTRSKLFSLTATPSRPSSKDAQERGIKLARRGKGEGHRSWSGRLLAPRSRATNCSSASSWRGA